MRKFLSVPFMLLACFASTMNLQAADLTLEDPETHVKFPSEVTIQQDSKTFKLQPTGISTRTKFIVKVYSATHYMENPPSGTAEEIFKTILTDNNAKEMMIQWTYAADVNKLKEGFFESFHKVLTEEQYKNLEKEITQYVNFYDKNMAVKDQHIIRWLPGGYVELQINGEKKGSLTNKEFASALWSIWFGPKSVLNRNRLISLLHPTGT